MGSESQTIVWRAALLVLVAGLTGYLLWYLGAKPLSMNLDGAMYLEGARTLLAGGQPYVDFVDINPPLAFYLHIPPVLLAGLTGLGDIGAFLALLIPAVLATALVTLHLTRDTDNATVLAALLIALVPGILLTNVLPDRELGQRSHLFVIALLPWLCLRIHRVNGGAVAPWLAVSIGLAMGISLCLKPLHYAAIMLPVELYVLTRHKQWPRLFALENNSIIAVVIAYGFMLLSLSQAASDEFFNLYLPLVLESYAAYGSTTETLWRAAAEHVAEALIVATACAVLMPAQASQRLRDIAVAGALIAWTAAAVFILQAKGWSYHAVPVWFGALLAAAALAGALLAKAPANRVLRNLATQPALWLTLGILTSGALMLGESKSNAKFYLKSPVATAIEQQTLPGDSVYIMSTSVDASYPLLPIIDRRQTTRYPFLFPVPMLYEDAKRVDPAGRVFRLSDARQSTEIGILRRLNSDLEREQPKLILVENYTPCLFCRGAMSLPFYIRRNAAELPAFDNYEETARIRRFTILTRIDGGAE